MAQRPRLQCGMIPLSTTLLAPPVHEHSSASIPIVHHAGSCAYCAACGAVLPRYSGAVAPYPREVDALTQTMRARSETSRGWRRLALQYLSRLRQGYAALPVRAV